MNQYETAKATTWTPTQTASPQRLRNRLIRQLQDAHYGKRYAACRFDSPVDYAALAESMGAFGARIDRPEEAASAIGRALGQAVASGRPAVIDCLITEPANVYPMAMGSTLLECVE